MHPQPSRRPAPLVIRLLTGGFSVLIGMLALFRPPHYLLWFMRLGVTEWGYWLLPKLSVLLLPGLRRRFGWSAWLLGAATLLAQWPLVSAWLLARQLPARLEAAFGPTAPAAPRPAPLVLADLWRGVPLPHSRPERLVYIEREGTPLHLDLYRPSVPAPAPLVVVIHGGAWQSGDSEQLTPLNRYLVAQGYAVAALTYRLSPQHRFPSARDDVLDAIAYLRTHAADFAIDADRIALLGRSAGAQLALLAAYTAQNPAIRGVVSFYGPTDMLWGYAHPANPAVIDTCAVLEQHLGGTPEQAPDAYRQSSPIQLVSDDTPATLLIHGAQDEMVFLENSTRLQARLAAAGRPHLLLMLPWAAHGCDANFSGPSGQLSTYAIEHFLAAVVGRRK